MINFIYKEFKLKTTYGALEKIQLPVQWILDAFPVGTRPKMNVFCTFRIGPFVPIKKDVF